MGYGEEDHRDSTPFAPHHFSGTYYEDDLSLLMFTLIIWLRQCLSHFSSLCILCSLEGNHYEQLALKGEVLGFTSLKQQPLHPWGFSAGPGLRTIRWKMQDELLQASSKENLAHYQENCLPPKLFNYRFWPSGGLRCRAKQFSLKSFIIQADITATVPDPVSKTFKAHSSMH